MATREVYDPRVIALRSRFEELAARGAPAEAWRALEIETIDAFIQLQRELLAKLRAMPDATGDLAYLRPSVRRLVELQRALDAKVRQVQDEERVTRASTPP